MTKDLKKRMMYYHWFILILLFVYKFKDGLVNGYKVVQDDTKKT